MHPIQERLLKLISQKQIGGLTLREIGELIDEKLPQKVKHHLLQLEQKGFILNDKANRKLSRVTQVTSEEDFFVTIPIVGSANCGPALIYADNNIEGYLKISKRFLSKQNNLYAVKAQGNSLNKANIHGKNIEPGDYAIIDTSQIAPADGDYVLSIIDGMANLKRYKIDHANRRVVLISESTQQFHPIFIHEDDEFFVNGKVIDVIKKFTY
jgi:repressor LexA